MKEAMKVGIGQTPQLCQDALIEMLRELFAGKKYNGQEGRKPLAIFKQDLPIPEENDVDADTDVAHAPYIVVRMTGGEIADDKSPQTVEFSLIICAYDTGIERAGFQDVANIKEDIVQRACTAPYFGGAFTILPKSAQAPSGGSGNAPAGGGGTKPEGRTPKWQYTNRGARTRRRNSWQTHENCGRPRCASHGSFRPATST